MTDTALATAPLALSEEQWAMIRNMYANGANDSEFSVLMEIAKARRLNPFLGQIHFVKRWNNERRAFVWATQTAIDGFRLQAQRTGEYDGQDEPVFEYRPDGSILLAKVRVYRKGVAHAAVGVAHFDEYVQRTKDGEITRMWREKPHVMISKCAEAIGFRKAFPDELSGQYTTDEFAVEQDTVRTETRVEKVAAEEEKPPERLPEKSASFSVLDWVARFAEAKTEQDCEDIGKEIAKAKPQADARKELASAYSTARMRIQDAG